MSDYPPQTLAIGQFVVEEAMDVFDICGSPDDFCIQHIGSTLIFGGYNRICWSTRKGFYPDRSYCSASFLEGWDKNYGSTPDTPKDQTLVTKCEMCLGSINSINMCVRCGHDNTYRARS